MDVKTPDGLPAAAQRGLKWFQFMASGLPSFLLALSLNYSLVTQAHWNKSLTYGLLLAMQVAINFFICRRWVFGRRDAHSLWEEFGVFFSGIMGFRLADWLLYTVLVQFVGLYFLAVQLGNVLLFSVLKFLFSERLFKKKEEIERQSGRVQGIQKLGLVLIVVLGFGLRFAGLNHDLHEEQVYHPDTPKQIRAVERFLDGHYYYHVGILDYDAYPYFNSHLMEYICRAGDAIHGGGQWLLGLPVTDWRPDYFQLFWMTRAWNALLAALLILIVFQLARENWDIRAAFAAALCLAVSPADVVACHFAGADTTAAFFATVSVFFAFRIYRLGRWCDYVWAALFTACAFSTKYHAGMAVLPVLLAHGLRRGTWRALVSRQSLGRLLLLALVGISATFLTTPTLLTHCSETVHNIFAFFTQISSYRGVGEGIRQAGWGTKLAFALHRNLPILVWIMGPLLCFGAVVGLKDIFCRRPEPRKVILYALPLIYFLLGVSLRPMAHPLYHTLMTPLVFVAAAVVFTRPFGRPENDRVWFAPLRLAVIIISAGLLLNTTAKEVFFFWHQDAGRVAKAWVEENVPPQFSVQLDNYSFSSTGFAPSTNAVGQGWAATRSEALPPVFKPVKNFALEVDRLAVFRNIPIRFYLNSSAWLRPDFTMPIGQRTGSANGNRVTCDDGVEFLHSEKTLMLEPAEKPTSHSLVRTSPLTEAWVGVQNGNTANLVEISLGGVVRRVSLDAGEIIWWRLAKPPQNWPSEHGAVWYCWSAQSFYGRARVLLATRPEEIGVFLFNAGNYRDALPLLQTASASSHNPLFATLALICAQQTDAAVALATQAELQPLERIHDAASCRQISGIAPAYLDALDFIKLEAENMRSAGCRSIADLEAADRYALEKVAVTAVEAATNPPPTIVTPMFQLDPGAYTLQLLVRGTDKTSAPIRWRMAAQDLFGTTYAETELDLPPLDDRRYTRVTTTFQIPLAPPELRLFLKPQNPAGVVLDQLEIKPDVLATVRWLNQMAQQPVQPQLGSTVSAGVVQTVATVFQGGLQLSRVQYERATIQRGQPLHMNFHLRLEQPGLDPANLAVFIHFTDEAGQMVFQGDFGVADLLNVYAPRFAAPVQMYKTIKVPAKIKPGVYTIRMGVCNIATTDRLRIVSSPLPQKTKAVLLREPLHVTE